MAGVTDFPYRQILREMGCKLLYTEMVSAKGLTYGNKRTEELIQFSNKGYIGVQLFGSKPETMAEAARKVEVKFKPDIIDINMGCPAPKITKNGAGSALMKDPGLTADIVKAVVEAVQLPVTVKIRMGWNENNINALNISKIAEDCGVEAVTVHGRTRESYYKGKADWKIIKRVKETVDIPVIGNGDIFYPEDALKMFEYTDCDAVMIGRGVQGNPWLIKRTIEFIKEGSIPEEPDFDEKINLALKHLKKSIKYYGEDIAVPRMRKHLAWYIKGLPYSTNIRDKINHLNKYNEIKSLLTNYLNQLNDYQN